MKEQTQNVLVNEVVLGTHDEEVSRQQLFALLQSLLRAVEVVSHLLCACMCVRVCVCVGVHGVCHNMSILM